MGQERRHFRDEFKTEAIALLAGSGLRLVEIAGELGISPSMLRNWRNRQGGQQAGRRCPRNRRRPCHALRCGSGGRDLPASPRERSAAPGARHFRKGYEAIHQGAQQHELADRKSGNGDNRERCLPPRRHPIGNLVESAMWLSDQEVMDPAHVEIADHHQRLPDQRMKRISDNGFECQKPGIMAPARTKGRKIGRCSPRRSRPAKLHGINPHAYLTDVLTKLVNNWPNRRLGELLPWSWAPEAS